MPAVVSRILVLYTGGTIGMKEGPRGFEPAPGYLAEQLERLPQFHDLSQPRFTMPPSRFGKRAKFDIKEYEPLLDSSNMDMEDWARIAVDIGENYEKYDAFVVLHGTDTMAYTASALSFMLENLTKTVIFTGSQIPLTQAGNDGMDNLLGALTIAAHFELPEVCLYFSHRLLRGNRAQKMDAAGFEAFASGNFPPLVKVGTEFEVHWDGVMAPSQGPFQVHTRMNRNVAALRLFPGITREIIANFLRPPLEGLVIETYGTGNAPDRREDFLAALREAADRGLVIVNCTQCHRGMVSTAYAAGTALAEIGVIGGADMTPEAALAKLSFLLGLGLPAEEVKRRLRTSLRGELTEAPDIVRFSFREAEFIRLVHRVIAEARRSLSPNETGAIQRALAPVLLCSAASLGELGALKEMLGAGSDVNAGDYDGRTALHLAASEGHTEVVRFLLHAGAEVNARDRWKGTPLDDALRHGHQEVVELLRRHSK